jgi:hypothetical protein
MSNVRFGGYNPEKADEALQRSVALVTAAAQDDNEATAAILDELSRQGAAADTLYVMSALFARVLRGFAVVAEGDPDEAVKIWATQVMAEYGS